MFTLVSRCLESCVVIFHNRRSSNIERSHSGYIEFNSTLKKAFDLRNVHTVERILTSHTTEICSFEDVTRANHEESHDNHHRCPTSGCCWTGRRIVLEPRPLSFPIQKVRSFPSGRSLVIFSLWYNEVFVSVPRIFHVEFADPETCRVAFLTLLTPSFEPFHRLEFIFYHDDWRARSWHWFYSAWRHLFGSSYNAAWLDTRLYPSPAHRRHGMHLGPYRVHCSLDDPSHPTSPEATDKSIRCRPSRCGCSQVQSLFLINS